jgi:hypothetical protein
MLSVFAAMQQSLLMVTRRREIHDVESAVWNRFAKIRQPCFRTPLTFLTGQRSP